jgi:hypothetical protein
MSRFLNVIREKGAGKATLGVEAEHETSMFVPEEKLREEDLVRFFARYAYVVFPTMTSLGRNWKCS